jgi:hypothetical protein
MLPLSDPMKNALKYYCRGRTISYCGYATMEGLYDRGLCSEPTAPVGSSDWVAELTDYGREVRTKLLIEAGPGVPQIQRELQGQRVLNHPITRLSQARDDALDAVRVYQKSYELPAGAVSWSLAVVEGIIDSLEARTQRVLVCPERYCHYADKGPDASGVCPEHTTDLLLAVMYLR